MLTHEVRRAAHALSRALDAEVSELSLTHAEGHVLAHLAAGGAQTPGAVARDFGHRQSTVTSILDRLESKGLVRRQPNPDDRRSLLVTATPAGRRAGARLANALAALEQRVEARVSRRDLVGIAAWLAALEEELDER
jgi:DNA-binding MarR family transcriptional regulator